MNKVWTFIALLFVGGCTDNPPASACCEPDAMPMCFEGAFCCADGTWQCGEPGAPACGGDEGNVCEEPPPEPPPAPCCEPDAMPMCFEGAFCCADGTWQCGEPGAPACGGDEGNVCEEPPPEPPPAPCCEPDAMPMCFEGAFCCADGTWQCGEPGAPACGGDEGNVCEEPPPEPPPAPCCEPDAMPMCFEGAFCCADGTWQCGEPGAPACGGPGQSGNVCDAPATPETPCDGSMTPPCFEGATCCSGGSWVCIDPGRPGDPCELASSGNR